MPANTFLFNSPAHFRDGSPAEEHLGLTQQQRVTYQLATLSRESRRAAIKLSGRLLCSPCHPYPSRHRTNGAAIWRADASSPYRVSGRVLKSMLRIRRGNIPVGICNEQASVSAAPLARKIRINASSDSCVRRARGATTRVAGGVNWRYRKTSCLPNSCLTTTYVTQHKTADRLGELTTLCRCIAKQHVPCV